MREITLPEEYVNGAMLKLKSTARYRKTQKGVLTNIYNKMKERSAKKGMPPVSFTLEEFHKKYLFDEEFDRLFTTWENGGYLKSKKPSADRINPMLGYTLENISFVTWAENRRKADWEKSFLYTTSVDMLDRNGNILRSFESIKEAALLTGIPSSTIIRCSQTKSKTITGYAFRYRGDKQRTSKTRKYCNIHDHPELLQGGEKQ